MLLPMYSTGQSTPVINSSSSHGHAPAPTPRLALHNLENHVSHYLGQAVAPSTSQAYQSGQRRFSSFCQEAGLQPLPLTESLLCLFVSHLAVVGLTHSTIKSYLSAVRFFHITAGQGDPFVPGAFPRLQYVLRGIKRAPHPAPRLRLPITPSLLNSMKSVWESRAAD